MEYWKFKAKDKLKDYKYQQMALKTLPLEINNINSKMESIRSAGTDGTPVIGGGSTREDMLLSSIVMKAEHEAMYKRAKRATMAVEKALEMLTEEEKTVLDRMYIHGTKGSLERLSDELCLHERSVYKLIDRALYHFTIAMYGATEN